MITARRSLLSNIRGFFETELRGIFSWDEVEHKPSRLADPIQVRMRSGKFIERRNPLGKYREMAEIKFGDFEITIRSAEDMGQPLGQVELRCGSGEVIGPIDAQTWVRAGQFVRENLHG